MDHTNKSPEQLLDEIRILEKRIEALTEQHLLEQKAHAHTRFLLQERKKELKCHQELTVLFATPGILVEEVMHQLLTILRESWQFPELAMVAVTLNENRWETPGFRKSDLFMEEIIRSGKETLGLVTITYPPEAMQGKELIFLPEEQDLLSSVAGRVGLFMESYGRAERVLHQTRLYQSFMHASPDALTITDLNGIIEYTSPAGVRIFGHSDESQSLGKNLLEFIAPDDRPRAIQGIERMFGGNFYADEYRGVRGDGSLFPIEVNGEFIRNDEGKPVQMIFITRDTTDRKSAVITGNPDTLLILDDRGNYLEYYPSDSTRLFLPDERIVGKNLRDSLDEGQTALRLEKLSECLACNRMIEFESELNFPGVHRYINIRLVPLQNRQVLAVIRDITERKQKDQEIRRLSQAVEQSPVIIAITSLDGNLIYVNPAFTAITGYTAEESLGRNPRFLKSGKTPRETYDDLWENLKNGRSWRGEWVNRKKSGAFYWEDVSISPILGDDGEPAYYLALKQDITRKKEVEAELRDLNENLEKRIQERTAELAQTNMELETFFSVALDLLCIADTEGHFVKVNKAWEDILGYSKEDLETRKFLDFVHPDDMPLTLDAIGRLSEQKTVSGMVNRYKAKEGDYRWIEWKSVPVGKMIYAAARDITERLKGEEDLRAAKKEAEDANTAKSDFLSRMSHELRTPMNSILGFAQLLQRGNLDEKQKKGVGHILNSGKHLLSMINEVLDISRIEAGKLSLSPEPLRICPVVEDVVTLTSPLAMERGITISISAEVDRDITVKADAQRLKQVLFNLLSNAVKYNKEDGKIFITIEQHPHDTRGNPWVRLSVKDTGMGIPDAFKSKVFTPFSRLWAETSNLEGTGLGLTVVKKLVEAMHGQLGFISEEGVGSTFWVELPSCSDRPEKTGVPPIQDVMDGELSGTTGTLLYVEDVRENVELVKQVLEEAGSSIRVISTHLGAEAPKIAIQQKPDLILLDLNLPDIHGKDVFKLLQSHPETRSIPVVVLSADAMSHTMKQLIREGVKEYLTKPLEIGNFMRIVIAYFGKQQP